MHDWLLTKEQKQVSGGMTAFSTNGAELDILWGEKKLNLSLIPYTKINSKWAMNHLKYKTINLLEKN